MSISNLWEMAKADRYTADGREAIAKAREADVEDKTYQIGEISQKTGLQKTAEGWVTPKGKANAAIEAKGKSENKSDKWEKNKDYLNRERISMKTPSGGYVSIYESENPNQKNNRFRVDTGDYYNDFNTLDEAKAFAEKEYGGNTPLQHTSASQEVQESVYKDIKNNGLEDYTVEEIAKEYGTTRGDAEAIWSRLNNEDSAPRQLTGDCKITIKG